MDDQRAKKGKWDFKFSRRWICRVVTPCELVSRYRRFGGIYCLHLQSVTRPNTSTEGKTIVCAGCWGRFVAVYWQTQLAAGRGAARSFPAAAKVRVEQQNGSQRHIRALRCDAKPATVCSATALQE
jgi:hypothetical protein